MHVYVDSTFYSANLHGTTFNDLLDFVNIYLLAKTTLSKLACCLIGKTKPIGAFRLPYLTRYSHALLERRNSRLQVVSKFERLNDVLSVHVKERTEVRRLQKLVLESDE